MLTVVVVAIAYGVALIIKHLTRTAATSFRRTAVVRYIAGPKVRQLEANFNILVSGTRPNWAQLTGPGFPELLVMILSKPQTGVWAYRPIKSFVFTKLRSDQVVAIGLANKELKALDFTFVGSFVVFCLQATDDSPIKIFHGVVVEVVMSDHFSDNPAKAGIKELLVRLDAASFKLIELGAPNSAITAYVLAHGGAEKVEIGLLGSQKVLE
jgi:hypothetical protein